jgi:hypothetical protein
MRQLMRTGIIAFVSSRWSVSCLVLAVTVSVVGCAREAGGRYLVTASAIDVGLGMRLCLAVEARDPQGVWWWQPGASGCARRSTGPGVFHADQAQVSRGASPDVAAVSFRLGLHSRTPTFLDARLAIQDGRMRSLDTGSEVGLHHLNVLDVRPDYPDPAPAPEKPPGR